MDWKEKALKILRDSLYPIPSELNELDWKSGLSDKSERLAQFLYPRKSLKDMTKQEKISACYQHACLMYEDGEKINNQSIRDRFELSKNDSSIASRIISDTLEAGLIKPADIETASKKYMTYIPYYG